LEEDYDLPEDADLSSETSWIFPSPELMPSELPDDELPRVKKRNALLARARRLARAAHAASLQANQLGAGEASNAARAPVAIGRQSRESEEPECQAVESSSNRVRTPEPAGAVPDPAKTRENTEPEVGPGIAHKKFPRPAITPDAAEPKFAGGNLV
jgi:hypothetical protein